MVALLKKYLWIPFVVLGILAMAIAVNVFVDSDDHSEILESYRITVMPAQAEDDSWHVLYNAQGELETVIQSSNANGLVTVVTSSWSRVRRHDFFS